MAPCGKRIYLYFVLICIVVTYYVTLRSTWISVYTLPTIPKHREFSRSTPVTLLRNGSQADIGSKANGSQADIGSKTNGSQTDIGSKANGIQTDIGSKANGSQTDIGSKANGSQADIGSKSNGSQTDIGSNITVSHEESSQQTKTHISISTNLWKFEEPHHQQLYLLENLIRRQWTQNNTNLNLLREELATYRSELNGSSRVLLHQKNVKVKAKFSYVYQKGGSYITSQLFRQLPKTNPLLEGKRYKSCAVVGNSGCILNSSCGESIDAHQFVMRCNIAPLAPFKADAGRKSNFTSMNPSLVKNKFSDLKDSTHKKYFEQVLSEFRGLVWIPSAGYFSDLPTAQKAMRAHHGNNSKIVCLYPSHFKAVVDFWKERELTSKMSTGFYLATTAIQLCDAVHLYGFWPFHYRYAEHKMPVPYHYFENRTSAEAEKNHSMDEEFSFLVQLHNLGVVKLHVGPCT